MSETKFADQLQGLKSRVEPLEKLVHALAGRLPQPLWYHSGKQHYGFRYGKPDVRHFCLVKAVRAVSAVNAAIELARCGYAQEIGVLIRTVIECTTHIEFVLSARDAAGSLEPAAAKYVQDYFDDFARNSAADVKRAQVRQGTVHKQLGEELDITAHESGRDATKVKAEQLYSNVYRTYSNYVHGKYPETMDLYGGNPGQFHLRGMSGTPKDAENIEIIDTFVTTVSITLMLMVTQLKLHDLVDESDPVLAAWFRSTQELDVDRPGAR
jgi:hypothetical protein